MASADIPAGSQVWHPGHEGHKLVLVYENALSVITQHHILIPSQRRGENLSMAKETLFLLSLFASILEPARKYWSHNMNISLSFQKVFIEIPEGCLLSP